jgi:acyl-CoA synthetase (AMP-forming)/AMP-acid ligase II
VGLERGAVVALFSPNLPEYAVVVIGAIRAGCLVTTINPLLTAGEIGQQLRDCGARLIVTVPELVGQAAEAAAGSQVRDMVVIGDSAGPRWRGSWRLAAARPRQPASSRRWLTRTKTWR